MKLYYDPVSTSSRIVTFFLHDQAIPFDEEIVSLAAGDHAAADFLALNPNGQVPVLVDDDGFRLTQSSAIIRHIAIERGLAAYPDDPRERARVDEAVSWFQTSFHVFHCALLSYTYILPQLTSLDPAVLATMRGIGRTGSDRFLRVLDRHMIGDAPFVCGETITLADYVGVANVVLGGFAGLDFAEHPNVRRWLRTLQDRPGWPLAHAGFEGALAAFRSSGRD
ncbi:glutathione S-transferase family protein [Pinisolibacter sp.]|uniref:glutathione S-transferase family protein n=1 Tax=Pinisolibacter sp. TaxID=2172024 RepID=UPI002FDCF461